MLESFQRVFFCRFGKPWIFAPVFGPGVIGILDENSVELSRR